LRSSMCWRRKDSSLTADHHSGEERKTLKRCSN
jgi:hypothetical protein